MNLFTKDELKPVIFILILSAICALTLAIFKEALNSRINTNRENEKKITILNTLKLKFNKKNPQEIQSIFDTKVFKASFPGINEEYFVYKNDDKIMAYVIPIKGKGLWGMIHGFLAIDPAISKIISVRFHEHEETPGLGGRISDEDYISKFDGKKYRTNKNTGIKIIKNASAENEVDAISGATITGDCIEKIINQGFIKAMIGIKKGGMNNAF
jgi:Na+-transporting NADH:ubiquinone oxidoreductase subunit C